MGTCIGWRVQRRARSCTGRVRRTRPSRGDKQMNLYLPDEHINELQRRSIEKLIEAARGMHHADLTVRKGGQDQHFRGRLAAPPKND